jgi:hypothetical protein
MFARANGEIFSLSKKEKTSRKRTKHDTLVKKALAEITKMNKVKGLSLHNIREDDARSIGKKVYRFTAIEEADPNGPQYNIVLDETGEILDSESLNRDEGRRVFATKTSSVSTLSSMVEVRPIRTITIEPLVNELVLKKDKVHEEVITVKVPGSTAASKVDVYFLADTTSSMSDVIDEVRNGASIILSTLSSYATDMAFGVGNYRDFISDDYAFDHQLNPSTNVVDVDNAINSWTAYGGGDQQEAQLYALDQLAESPGGPIGWRTGSKRIIVWFGDYPGHDPICQKVSGLSYDITEASVIKKLVEEGIIVLAISTTTGVDGLDGDPAYGDGYDGACEVDGNPNQATNISKATGGIHVKGIDASTIVNTIIELVATAVSSIRNLSLVPTGDSARFVASISPASGYGPLEGDKDHTLRFEVRFVGVENCGDEPKVFTGTIDAVADGSIIASKRVSITVPPCEERVYYSYSVKFVCGTQEDCGCTCTPVRPGKYATEISIHNYGNSEAIIQKLVLPVVFAGAPVGREPKIVQPKMFDKIRLLPNTATMDDCCRIAELLFGGKPTSPMPITIGFLEVISPVKLHVSAVYTVSDLASNSISMNVEQIEGHPKPIPERSTPLPDKGALTPKEIDASAKFGEISK